MSSSQNVSFDQQIRIHNRYSSHRFLKVDPILATNPEIGPVAAMIYAALLNHFRILTAHDQSPTYRQIQDNNGWFYISQSELAAMTGWTHRAIGTNLQKIVGVLISEKKVVVNKCERSAYCFLDWAEGGCMSCIGDACRASPYARVQNNKEYIIEENNVRGRRVSVPGKPKTYKLSTPVNTQPVFDRDIHPKFIEFASMWEPLLTRNKNITPKQIERAARILQNLVKDDHFSFKEIQETVEYGYNDTVPDQNGFCWRKYFTTLTGLHLRNTNSKSNSEDTKFQKIRNSFLRNQAQDPSVIFNERIEAIIRKVWPNDNDEYKRCLRHVDWVQEQLDDIRSSRPAQHQFIWHEGDKFIEMVQWMMELENSSEYEFKFYIEPYLEFLKYKLQDGSIKTLYAGYFKNDSELFNQFLKERYRVTGEKYFSWQRGDYE